MVCGKFVCDKDVSVCVTKLCVCVIKLCVKDGHAK